MKRGDETGGYDIYSIDFCLILLFSSTMKIYKFSILTAFSTSVSLISMPVRCRDPCCELQTKEAANNTNSRQYLKQ